MPEYRTLAGNISAYWMGYEEFHERGKATRLPKMLGFQAAGSAPIFYNKVIEHPETVVDEQIGIYAEALAT